MNEHARSRSGEAGLHYPCECYTAFTLLLLNSLAVCVLGTAVSPGKTAEPLDTQTSVSQ